MSDIDELDWNRLRSGDLRALNPDHQDVFNMVFDLQAENERLRAYKTEIEHWIDLGERMIEPAAQWGPGGNVMVQTSTMFKLGAWWADRPWRVREAMGE